jgi:hypothetical protein
VMGGAGPLVGALLTLSATRIASGR